jgi:chromosome segregation ATPase
MQSGRDTLASIDQALHQVRGQVQEMDAAIQSASTQIVALRQAEATCYRQLAQLRVGQLVSGEIVAGFEQAEQRVADLITQREQALQALQQQIEASQAQQHQLESERAVQHQRVAEASERLDRAEAATQKRLQDDRAYQEQVHKARQADAIAKQAEAKTAQAEADRLEKGTSYEADTLFMYLWKRGYGTSQYSANPIARFFDKKVAALCRYHDARPNYAMLLEIPVRLREHAQRVRANAEQEFQALTALERTAAEADGLPVLRQAVDEAEQRLDTIDERIQEAEERFRQLLDEKAEYASGEDALFRQAISTLVGQFEREGIMALRRQAEATRTVEDDRIVQELAEIDRQQEALEATLAQHKQLHSRQSERLQQLEEVRRRFKRERYDDVHSAFTNTALLATILNQFLRGGASSDTLWGTMHRHQRYRRIESDPGFGSGSFGRPGSVWHFPSSSGGFGGGGFSSGGGFGGGGFQTRGGF